MKNILIAIRLQWVEKIASGQKTIEVRKTAPQEVPFKAYIYCTKGKPYLYRVDDDDNFELTNTLRPKVDGYVKDYNEQNGKVIGEFICDKVDEYNFHNGLVEFNSMGLPSRIYSSYFILTDDYKSMCLSYDEVKNYGNGKTLYGWHISDLKIYDEPRKLSEFYTIDKSGDDCCIACVYHETPVEEMPCKTCTGERRYLYRPPQSWQYVEEVEQ